MPQAVPGKNGGTLYPPKKGETNNPNGRPKSPLNKLAEELGERYDMKVCKSDLRALLNAIAFLPPEELKKLNENPNTPLTIKTMIKAMGLDHKLGRTKTADNILDRLLGKATQVNEHQGVDGAPLEAPVVNILPVSAEKRDGDD